MRRPGTGYQNRTPSFGIVAVRQNARLKLDRLGVAFGESGQTDGRRAADRFTYDEMNNMRRCRYCTVQAVPGAAVQRPQGAPRVRLLRRRGAWLAQKACQTGGRVLW